METMFMLWFHSKPTIWRNTPIYGNHWGRHSNPLNHPFSGSTSISPSPHLPISPSPSHLISGRDPRHVDGLPHSPGRSQQLGAPLGAAHGPRHGAGDHQLRDPLDLRHLDAAGTGVTGVGLAGTVHAMYIYIYICIWLVVTVTLIDYFSIYCE